MTELKEVTGPTEAEIQKETLGKLHQLVQAGKIHVEKTHDAKGLPGPDQYIIARSTFDPAEAVQMCERFDLAYLFDQIKQVCFINGMVDGVKTYRNEIRKLGGVAMDKAVARGNFILAYLESQRGKVDPVTAEPDSPTTRQ